MNCSENSRSDVLLPPEEVTKKIKQISSQHASKKLSKHEIILETKKTISNITIINQESCRKFNSQQCVGGVLLAPDWDESENFWLEAIP